MILLTLALIASSPLDAAPAAPTVPAVAPTQTAALKNDPDEVICHKTVTTGSRLGAHKECHTRRDWDQLSADAGEVLTKATTLNGTGK